MPVNPGAPIGDSDRRHMLRRAGLGPLPKDFQALQKADTRGEAAEILLAFRAKPCRPAGKDFEHMHNKWVKFILKTKTTLHSKLVLFWHDHFSTGFSKVMDTKLMGKQIQTLHTFARGNFKDFVKAIGKDPAMMEFLDTVRNRKRIPNENYARELQELFTLGVMDHAATPQPNYTQDDIVQIARAFTGWDYDEHGNSSLNQDQHDFEADFPGRGPKVIYKSTGGFGPGGSAYDDQGEGPQEIDRVIDIIFEHQDSEGKNTVARRTAFRLCEYLAHPDPAVTTFVDEVVADSGFDTTWDIGALVRSIMCHDDFYLTAAGESSYNASGKKSVKWPIDYVASTLRLLQMKPKGKSYQIQGGSFRSMLDHLSDMGQILGDPPSVFGWDWESGWVSSAALLARYNFARDLVAARDGGGSFKPEKLMDLNLTDPDDIIDAAAAVLGLQDHLKVADKTMLRTYLTDNGANPTLDLNDFDTRNSKLHGLFSLMMESPAYQLH